MSEQARTGGRRRRNKRLGVGLRRRPNGKLEAYVEVYGRTRSKTFPPGTARGEIERWRAETRLVLGGRAEAEAGTLADDIERHGAFLRTNRTHREQMRVLARWVEELGPRRRRSSITTEEIQRIVNRWTAEGRKASSIHKWVRQLQSVWSNLDGADARNPVRSVRRPKLDPVEARGLPPERVRALIAEVTTPWARAVCRVMAWVGLTQEQMRQLRPADIDWRNRTVRTRGRNKGAGAPARVVPLLEDGVEALREFDRLNVYGRVSNRRLWEQVRQAGKRIGEPNVRPYDLRHSFATLMYEATGDLSTTAHLLGHTNTQTTRRYALNAVPAVARAGIEKAENLLAARKRTPPAEHPRLRMVGRDRHADTPESPERAPNPGRPLDG